MKWSLGSVLYYPETGEMKIPNMGIGIDGSNFENGQNNIKNEEPKLEEEPKVEDKKIEEPQLKKDNKVKNNESEGNLDNE